MTQLVIPSLHVGPASASSNGYPSTCGFASKHGSAQSSSATTVPADSVARAIKGVGDLVLSWKDGLSESEREHRRRLEERKQIYMARLQNAEDYLQWHEAAQELDILEGNEAWKAETSTGDYNPELVEKRLQELDEARINCDLRSMLHLVRTALSRDLGGMGNIDLYRHSYTGTKKLIERYVESALQTITSLVDRSAHGLPSGLETKDILDAVLSARQSFGRSALLLSGGGTFGMTHIGVLKSLYEVKLLPRIISGASAGSIVAAVCCARTDDEIPQLLEEFPHGDLSVFEEAGNEDNVLDHLRRLLTQGSWSDIKHLTRVMRGLLGDITFQEAYNRTRRILNICVSSASIYELPRLLNYVTAPNVMIWSAVAASCSVPLIFRAAPLFVKDPITGEHGPWNPTPQMWIDGSVDNDLPMTRLAEMFNVNHFIVSQVNPHVVPFLAKNDAPYAASQGHSKPAEEGDWMNTITELAKGEALHRMQVLAEIGIFPTLVSKLRSVLSQKYSGDINILPAIGVLDLPKILQNPTTDFMHRSCLLGERATWPKLARIRDRCAIELALDRAVHALRARVVFSRSQVNLRRMATGSMLNSPYVDGTTAPSSAVAHAEGGFTAREKFRHRHRRSSVSNFQPTIFQRRLEDPYKITDDDTDMEERLEMSLRRRNSKPKLKLKRSNLKCFPTGAMTTSHLSSTNEPDIFDFAQPPVKAAPAPPKQTIDPSTVPTVQLSVYRTSDLEENADLAAVDAASMTSPVDGPSHLCETSEAHSSDADIDSHSEGSTEGAIPSSGLEAPDHETDKDWVPKMAMQSKPSKEDMFSLARREEKSWLGIDHLQDPRLGLWS